MTHYRQPTSSPFDARNLDAAPPGPIVFADEFVFGPRMLPEASAHPNGVVVPSPYQVWDPSGLLDENPPWVDQRRQMLMLDVQPAIAVPNAFQWAGVIRPIPAFTDEQLEESHFQIYGRSGIVRCVSADLADAVNGQTQFGMMITNEADFGVSGDGKFLVLGHILGDRLVLPQSREWTSASVPTAGETSLQTAMGSWVPTRMNLLFSEGDCTIITEVSPTGEGWLPIDFYNVIGDPPVWVGLGATGYRGAGSGGTFALDYLRMYDVTETDGSLITDGARLFGG